MYPYFAIYQQRTRREVPLLRLSDRAGRGRVSWFFTRLLSLAPSNNSVESPRT